MRTSHWTAHPLPPAASLMTCKTELYTFGCGFDGRLGHGKEAHSTAPQRVEFFQSDHEIVAVATGGYHTLVWCRDGLYAFGCNENGQLGVDDKMNRKTPAKIGFFDGRIIKNIFASQYCSYVQDEEGLWSFGCGEGGPVPLPPPTPPKTPKRWVLLSTATVIKHSFGSQSLW